MGSLCTSGIPKQNTIEKIEFEQRRNEQFKQDLCDIFDTKMEPNIHTENLQLDVCFFLHFGLCIKKKPTFLYMLGYNVRRNFRQF